MPLISHEIPKALFDRHDEVSDYPYVLGHLLSLDTEYADFYKQKIERAEYSILDNSAFELGKSIPMEELYELGKEYLPTNSYNSSIGIDLPSSNAELSKIEYSAVLSFSL